MAKHASATDAEEQVTFFIVFISTGIAFGPSKRQTSNLPDVAENVLRVRAKSEIAVSDGIERLAPELQLQAVPVHCLRAFLPVL